MIKFSNKNLGIIFFIVSISNSNAQALNQASLLEMRAIRAEYQNAMRKFCHAKAPYHPNLIEEIGARFSFDPRSISFARAYLTENTLSMNREPYGTYHLCMGVFYTPRGPLECGLTFASSGQIMSCDNFGSRRSYTENLRDSYYKKYSSIYPFKLPEKSPEEKDAQYDPETKTWGPGKF